MQMDAELAMRILGLTKEEVMDTEKVKSAYRTIVRAIHPDHHQEAAARFDSLMGLVNEAYNFINSGGVSTGRGFGGNQGGFQPNYTPYQPYQPYQPGASWAGWYRPGSQGGPNKTKKRLFITFDDLKKLYNGFTGQITTKTDDGNSVMIGLHDLKKYDTILLDKIAFVLSKNGSGTPKQFEIRKTRGQTDVYIMDITCRVPEGMEFPMKFKLSYPMNYEATISNLGKWEITCDINKVGLKLILRLNVIQE